MKFKVGDRVKCVKAYDGKDEAVGEVVTIITKSDLNLVEFDVNVDGHSGAGRGKAGCCWWFPDSYLELARDKNECIVIYRKDNTVTALNKSTGDKAVAKCNPADEFDFMTGAKLAFERLVTPPAVKAGDWVKVLSGGGHSLTVGKIYKVVTVHKIPKKWVRVDKGYGSYDTLRDNQYVIVPDYVAPDSIKVGDRVKVIDVYCTYKLYNFWSGLKGYESHFVKEKTPVQDHTYEVLNVSKHDDRLSDLLLIQDKDTTQVFIIGVDGVEKC